MCGRRWPKAGFSMEDVNEIVLQQAIYCGAPAALTAVNVARQVLDEIEGRS